MPSIPALAQILIVFSLVVFAAALKVHMGLAAALGGILLALWSGLEFAAITRVILEQLFEADTLLLLALMTGIMAFSSAMKKSGGMDTFAKAISDIAPSRAFRDSDRPSPYRDLADAGRSHSFRALSSKPWIPTAQHEAETLAAANYWFRHTLELAWPLYPAFILDDVVWPEFPSQGSSNSISMPLPSSSRLDCYSSCLVPREKYERQSPLSLSVEKHPFSGASLAFITGIAPLAFVLGVYMASRYAVEIHIAIFCGFRFGKGLDRTICARVRRACRRQRLRIGFRAGGFGGLQGQPDRIDPQAHRCHRGNKGLFRADRSGRGWQKDAASELTGVGNPALLSLSR